MKIIERSLRTATKLLPDARGKRALHFAFAYYRNKLVASGINHNKTSPRVKRLGEVFKNHKQITYSHIHAEIDLLSRLISYEIHPSEVKIVSLRLSPTGEVRNAKPCSECERVLLSFGATEIYFSDSEGSFAKL